MLRRTNREPFGRQLIKAPCFTRHYDTAPMWSCQSRKTCGTGLQKQLHVYIRKAHQSTIWGIDESINGTGLLKRNCKKCRCSFGTGISYRFTVRLTHTVVKQKKKGRSGYMKSHKFFAWATVFCFVMTMITGYKRQ